MAKHDVDGKPCVYKPHTEMRSLEIPAAKTAKIITSPK